VKADLETPLDPTVVARQILRTTDAAATAELAAWWALAGAGEASEGIVLSSVLAIPGERGDAAGTFDELEAAFRADIETAANQSPWTSMRGPKSEPRVALERGQGESWLLVANGCALAKESEWDAGRSALVVRLAASLGTLSAVVLEPWVEPAGVGLLARTRQLPGETNAATGRRLGMMAGMALTSLSSPEERFARTKSETLRHLSTPSARRIEGLLPRLEGLAPSWLRPEGLLERQLATSVDDIDERWRTMLREPWRAAMVASLDTDEAQVAFAEIARWIPMSDDAACTVTQPTRSISQATERWLGSGVEPHAFLAIPGEGTSEGPIAAVVAAHLTNIAPRVSSVSHAFIMGSGRKPMLVIEIVASGAERDAAVLAWRREFESLRTNALSEDEFTRAQVVVSRERARSLESPRGRVAALWRGDRVTPVSAAEVRDWMARDFVNERIQILIGDPQAP
jgi:hypothetical protein